MRKLYILLFILLLAASCNNESFIDTNFSDEKQATTFLITRSGSEIEEVNTRSSSSKPIDRLWYAVFDSNDRIIHPPHQVLQPDLSSLTIENLRDGNYSIVFLATTDKDNSLTIPELTDIHQQWLSAPTEGAPLNYDFFHKRISFTVDKDNDSRTIPIELERNVGKVEVAIDAANEYSKRFIRKVEISYDTDSPVAKYQLADGSYGGSEVIRDFNITQSLGFYSFPATKKLSGTVTITALRSDNSSFVSNYKFNNSEIISGKISTIHINWTHPEDKMGMFYVRAQDFNASNSTSMFLPDEPSNIFISSKRVFYVDQPLQLNIDNNHELLVRFYSALPIYNVKVLCRLPKYSNEFFELAHYDEIPAYHESHMPIPLVSGNRIFLSESGRLVEIPAQSELTDKDCQLKFETDDPYMEKIARIKPHWRISFSNYSAGAPDVYWQFMKPIYCRQGVVLVTNMAYMYSSPEFQEVLQTNISKLYDNGHNPISIENLNNRLKNHSGLVMGLVAGVQGLGGGNTYGLASYRYTDHYWDVAPRNNIRTTPFHELGHCLGYSHDSNMTYGLWPTICSELMWDMGNAGKLLVNTKKVLSP